MSDLAYSTLLQGISDVHTGTIVTADTLRPVFDAAQLTSAEKSGAFKAACAAGYLYAVTMLLEGRMCAVSIPSEHEAGKGRLIRLYRRTGKPVPEHTCQVAS